MEPELYLPYAPAPPLVLPGYPYMPLLLVPSWPNRDVGGAYGPPFAAWLVYGAEEAACAGGSWGWPSSESCALDLSWSSSPFPCPLAPPATPRVLLFPVVWLILPTFRAGLGFVVR